MKTLGYYNGRYDELDKMMIPMNDRVCWFGDGVYDAGPCRNYNIFALDEHVDRFFNNAGLLQIEMPCTKEELKGLLCSLVHKMDTGSLFVYYQVTRGTAARTHEFPQEARANLWVTLKPLPSPELTEKIRLITLEDTRFLHCNIKTLNLIPSVMAAQKASEAGCQEAVFHRGGRVTECAHSNCHILKDKTLYTAPADNLILPGIARAHLIKICKKLGIPVKETPYTVEELMEADEILITSSSKFCMSASHVDGVPAGGKAPELLERIQEAVKAEFIEATN
ncbi:MAG: aminotransferase class IV [Clostridium sp.]|nr:aminotransferase class IV [Clostridium sp.]